MSGYRSNPVYQALKKVCDEYQLECSVEQRGKHPALIIEAGGKVIRYTFPGSPSDVRASINAEADLRRLIEDALQGPAIQAVTVLGREIAKVEIDGLRVVTMRQIDEVHERPEGTARRQFNANRSRFVEGRDYFKKSANDFRTRFPGLISPRATEEITLLTERGYGKIVKGWNDDLAWALHDAMQDAYFLVKAVASAAASGALSEADWKRIGGIIKSVIVKQTEDMRVGTELCLEEVAKLARDMDGMRKSPVVPSFDFAGTVTSREIMDIAGIPKEGRVRGTTGGVITRCMKEFCLHRGVVARTTPENIDPDRRWRFPRSAALDWLNGPSLGNEVIRNHIAKSSDRAARRGQRQLTLVPSATA